MLSNALKDVWQKWQGLGPVVGMPGAATGLYGRVSVYLYISLNSVER